MSLLTLPDSPDGLALETLIGLPSGTAIALHAAGSPIPAPLRLRTLVDTGTDVTAVAPRVVQHFGLVPQVHLPTQTAGGSVIVRLFEVSLSIPSLPGMAGSLLMRPTILVMELTESLPNIEVLLGRDVLAECVLIADGPGQRFMLAW